MSREDTDSRQLSHLRLAAILSWYSRCPEARAAHEKHEAELRERFSRFRSHLVKMFGGKCHISISMNGGCLEAGIEDLRLVAYEYVSSQTKELCTMVSLVGRCASCGAEAMSEPFCDLPGLGKMLERFEPSERHLCVQPKIHIARKL